MLICATGTGRGVAWVIRGPDRNVITGIFISDFRYGGSMAVETTILEAFLDGILKEQRDIEPEFVAIVNENFWDLVEAA